MARLTREQQERLMDYALMARAAYASRPAEDRAVVVFKATVEAVR